MRPSDCAACGGPKERHNERYGWCWGGGIGEDATTYERVGYTGIIRAWWRRLMWRWRFRDVTRLDGI